MDRLRHTIELFDKFAQHYQDKFMDLDLYHDSFNKFCEAITKKDAAILELGCGPGNITKYLLQKRPDFKILATDLSQKMIELGQANNPTATFELMDCRAIAKLDKQYDGIMCGFCLPYLTKEESIQFIYDAHKILYPNGVLYISTMEDDYSKSGFKKPSSGGSDQLFIHYHEADYLTGALNANGFQIIDIRRQDYPEENGSSSTDLLILAKNNPRTR